MKITRKDIRTYILTAILSIPAFFVLDFITRSYRVFYTESTESVQLLIGAIMTSIFALVLHFFKKYPKIEKRHELMFESMEILLIVISPTLISIKLVKEVFPLQTLPIMVPIIAVLFLWYIAMLMLMSTAKNMEHSSPAFRITSLIYWGFIAMLIPLIEFGAQYDP